MISYTTTIVKPNIFKFIQNGISAVQKKRQNGIQVEAKFMSKMLSSGGQLLSKHH